MQVNELNVQNMILDEEHKMRLVGKIDRMDTRETEEAVYVRIIDLNTDAPFSAVPLLHSDIPQAVTADHNTDSATETSSFRIYNQ